MGNDNKLDLIEILKDAPAGVKLYSSVLGYVKFEGIDYKDERIMIKTPEGYKATYGRDGIYMAYCDAECTLFPSKEQRDWTKFEAPWKKKEEKDVPETYWVAYDSKTDYIRAYASSEDCIELYQGRAITRSKDSFGTLRQFSDFPYKIPSRGLDFDTFCEELKKHRGFLPDEPVLVPHVPLMSAKPIWMLKHYSHWLGEERIHVTTDEKFYLDKEIIPYIGNVGLLGCQKKDNI